MLLTKIVPCLLTTEAKKNFLYDLVQYVKYGWIQIWRDNS